VSFLKKTFSITEMAFPKQTRLRKKLADKIDSFNNRKAGPSRWKPLGLEAKDEKGKFVGGLTGFTYLGWLYFDILFVDQKLRGNGLGRSLLSKAEIWAKKNGCKYVHLSTMSFQAPGFYRKLGYKLYGQLRPFPKGNVRYYLKKKL
jgi:GNAT superfamily N-acetyltransferase